jgi:hypothetical protein
VVVDGDAARRPLCRNFSTSPSTGYGAAHWVDSVATALHAGMTVSEVGQLDFGYSPPFGPVWDLILLAAKALGDEMEEYG